MTSARSMALATIGALGLCTLTRSAAASPSARLVYGRAPEAHECPDEATLRRAVAARVGYDPFFPHADRTVVVTIARKDDRKDKDGRLTARIELVDDQARTGGARELTTTEPGCEELFESAALAVAIAIDPRALVAPASPKASVEGSSAEGSPPEPPSEPRPEPPAIATTAAEAPAAPAAERPKPVAPTASASVKGRASLHLRGASGVQPRLAPGAFVGFGVVARPLRVGPEEVWKAAPVAFALAAGASVDFE